MTQTYVPHGQGKELQQRLVANRPTTILLRALMCVFAETISVRTPGFSSNAPIIDQLNNGQGRICSYSFLFAIFFISNSFLRQFHPQFVFRASRHRCDHFFLHVLVSTSNRSVPIEALGDTVFSAKAAARRTPVGQCDYTQPYESLFQSHQKA